MFTRFSVILLMLITAMPAWADDALDAALRATYTACIGIDDQLSDMKKMAGINTAITGVGTGTSIGATVTGFVKAGTDKKIAELEKILAEIEKISTGKSTPSKEQADAFMAEFGSYYTTAAGNADKYKSEIGALTEKSKKLGNWRTGLLAGTTVTNIAGTAIAATNRVDDDLETQIANCVKSVNNLRNITTQSRISGVNVGEADAIINACGEFEYVDLSSINKRAMGAAISGGIGAGVGLVGTITSGLANSNKIRDDNTDAGKKKETDLNTTANVMSIGATAASATATIFNATQIAAIKKVANVAAQCTGVLQ